MKINNPNKLQRIKGISKKYRDVYHCSNNIKGLGDSFRGCYIDKFEISVVVENPQEMMNLIEALTNIYPCLRK